MISYPKLRTTPLNNPKGTRHNLALRIAKEFQDELRITRAAKTQAVEKRREPHGYIWRRWAGGGIPDEAG